MNGEKICPTCGRSNAPTARYCGNCGQMLAAASAQRPRAGEEVFTEADTVRSPFAPPHTRSVPPRPADAPRAERRAVHPLLTRADWGVALDPAACGILSFFFPGVGHVLCGHLVRGLWIIVGALVVVRCLHLEPFGFWMVIARLWAALEAHGLAKRRR